MHLSEAARHTRARLLGADAAFRGCSTDTRTLETAQLFVALRGERFDGHDYLQQACDLGAAGAMVEDACDAPRFPQLQVADTRVALGRLAAAWRMQLDVPLVAITGSNGKTTVKEMLASILSHGAPGCATRGNLNNDIGVPLTLFALGAEHRWGVIEMGANHPGEIAVLTNMVQPNVALVTQCAPAHLEGFQSVRGVAQAKGEIYTGLRPDGTAIINADDAYAPLWRSLAAPRRVLSFGLQAAADVFARDLSMSQQDAGTDFRLIAASGEIPVHVPLPGRHNVLNALAAGACALALDASLEQVAAGLAGASAVAGRLQIRRRSATQRVLDDSYNANPGSLRAGIDVLLDLPGPHWLVLGDMAELGADARRLHQDAGRWAARRGVDRLFSVGDLSRSASQAFGAGARHFEQPEGLCRALLAELPAEVTVLVKGSRSAAMERVVARLLED